MVGRDGSKENGHYGADNADRGGDDDFRLCRPEQICERSTNGLGGRRVFEDAELLDEAIAVQSGRQEEMSGEHRAPALEHPSGNEVEIATHGRHDPCVGIRAVPVGEAMMACVLADHLLRFRAIGGGV